MGVNTELPVPTGQRLHDRQPDKLVVVQGDLTIDAAVRAVDEQGIRRTPFSSFTVPARQATPNVWAAPAAIPESDAPISAVSAWSDTENPSPLYRDLLLLLPYRSLISKHLITAHPLLSWLGAPIGATLCIRRLLRTIPRPP